MAVKLVLYLLNFCFAFISESVWSHFAYVTFKDSQGADTAVLLSVSSNSFKSILAMDI
jgi:hypothetical protein